MVKKKLAHGGASPGAGRKPDPEGASVTVVVTVPGGLVERLDALAESEGWGRSKAVTVARRTLLQRKKR
jgi:hypothetical protein